MTLGIVASVGSTWKLTHYHLYLSSHFVIVLKLVKSGM
ncbi:hypothetical protein ES332_A13G099600v1 [Gossypium tomentosum]|uniref:Uncharacterized protein n=1 Tax=Gossypium tomentosum TaxID=34277 RepID=A0A5D2MIU6_GOSTO|nr:hypothetical protein ES332_A13G099600v1 [Gossypium tomentosum]